MWIVELESVKQNLMRYTCF